MTPTVSEPISQRLNVNPQVRRSLPDRLVDAAVRMVQPRSECRDCGQPVGTTGALALHAQHARDTSGDAVEFYVTHGACRTSRLTESTQIHSPQEASYAAVEALLPVTGRQQQPVGLPHLLVNVQVSSMIFTRPDGKNWESPVADTLSKFGFVPYGQPLEEPATAVAEVSHDALRVTSAFGEWRVTAPATPVVSAAEAFDGLLVVVCDEVGVDDWAADPTAEQMKTVLETSDTWAGWVRIG